MPDGGDGARRKSEKGQITGWNYIDDALKIGEDRYLDCDRLAVSVLTP
jgi:hypothetical protein